MFLKMKYFFNLSFKKVKIFLKLRKYWYIFYGELFDRGEVYVCKFIC